MEATQQMSPVSMLALMNSNKSQRHSFCLQIVEQVENGDVDPVKIHVYLKNLEAIFKTLTDEKTGKEFATRYKAALMDAVEKEGSKSFEKYNAKLQVKEAGTKYDYSQCGDSKVIELQAAADKAAAELKARQEFLLAVPVSGLVITDQDTGETSTVYPPAKSSTTTVSVTLS